MPPFFSLQSTRAGIISNLRSKKHGALGIHFWPNHSTASGNLAHKSKRCPSSYGPGTSASLFSFVSIYSLDVYRML
jgi:hypothetical protein